MKIIDEFIFARYNRVGDLIKEHPKVSLSKVETRFRSDDTTNKKNYFLSILLAGDFFLDEMESDSEPITEMVIDLFTSDDSHKIDLTLDLSYGNGIIIKELAVGSILIEGNLDDVFNYLDTHFFDSVVSEIFRSLDVLRRWN